MGLEQTRLAEQANTNIENSDLFKKIKTQIENMFDESKDPQETVKIFMEKIEPFFNYVDKKILSAEKITEIKDSLQACGNIADKNQFTDAVMNALRPVIRVKEEHAVEFEEAQMQTMNKEGGFIAINRLLSYGIYGPIVHLHAPPGKTVEGKRKLYLDGLAELAKIINQNPEIEEITATSHLVAEHQGLFKMLGFTVGDLPEESRKEHFAGEERELKIAKISREDFLKRFLK